MDENFQKLSHSSDTGAFENSDNIYSPSIFSSMDEIKINQSEFQSFFHDDFSFSRVSSMPRWKSDMENSNSPSNFSNQLMSSRENFVIDDYFGKKNKPSSSITDSIVSPMSRLSTSSSLMSFHSLNNYKSTEQLASRSTLMSSTDQLVVPNENINLLPTSSFLPLPMPSTNRPVLSTIDNTASSFIDNDLQRVPPSFMIIQPPSSYENTHVVQSAGRSNSMPSWRGYLPIRFESIANDQYQITTHFSQKVFLGGIPSELTEAELLLVLRKFGKCNIKWPKTDTLNSNNNIPSFCHVVFRESRSVSELLKHCIRQQQRSTTEYFLHIHMSPSSSLSIRTNRLKPIQVVPWNMKDNVYVMNQENLSAGETTYKDWSRTIFVSPLHGKMTGFSLGTIMANVFGPVSMAQVNTDKYGYPTGTGTVLFYDSHSYMRAVAAGAIDIKSDCFHKLLDIDPFLRENEPCAFCSSNADLFCRNFHCLRSYCRQCWVNRHGPKPLADHQPATRRHQPF